MLFQTEEPEYSGMQINASKDLMASKRRGGIIVEQTGICLNDMLATYGAPTEIDYVSIDTEGNELDILSTFDFDRFRVSLFTIEHNYTDADQKLDQLMLSYGYDRVHRAWSRWDAWYKKVS